MRSILFTLVVGATVVALALVITVIPRDDVPDDPDVVVVLGGAGVERAELGLELSRQYDAALVLSSSAAYYGVEQLGLVCGIDALCVQPEPENTQGEARLIAQLADEHSWERVTVATAVFHTSRARVLFRQCLGRRVTVVGAPGTAHRSTAATFVREAIAIAAAVTVRRAC